MLPRLIAAALLVGTLLAVAPAPAGATCAGLESGGDCIGAYTDCELEACPEDPYLCVGLYDGACTGVQKP